MNTAKALEKVIDEKLEKGDKAAPKPARKQKATNVIDLVAVLQKSLDQTGHGAKKAKKPAPAKRPAKQGRKAA